MNALEKDLEMNVDPKNLSVQVHVYAYVYVYVNIYIYKYIFRSNYIHAHMMNKCEPNLLCHIPIKMIW